MQQMMRDENDDCIFHILIPAVHDFVSQFKPNMALAFFKGLKSLLRSSNAVCLATVDQELISPAFFNSLFAQADSVLKVTSFKEQ